MLLPTATAATLVLSASLLLHTYALPTLQEPNARALISSLTPLDSVLLFDAPAFQDLAKPSTLTANIQAFVSVRQINLTPVLSSLSSFLNSTFDIDITNKLPRIEERLRLFAAIGLSGKDVKVSVNGCSAASGNGANLGETSGLPDLGMILANMSLGNCGASSVNQLSGKVRIPGLIGEDRFAQNTIFASASDGFGVISDIDDTIKITNTLDKVKVIQSTLLDDPQPVAGMPQLYASLATSLQNPQFIYISGSPFQLYPFLRSFISTSYARSRGPLLLQNLTLVDIPGILDFAKEDGIQEYKTEMIDRIRGLYPRKTWLAIGDSTQRDPETYGDAFRKYGPNFISCIWIRQVEGANNTDARFTAAFKSVPPSKFRVYIDTDITSLSKIDVKGGAC